ncbi:MAG: hypothetical protein RLZZ157_441 [Pseudomonadota bacterium]|jgi:uncharacterized membrane protein YdjX (TVP38/TMEM64 family)
MTQNLKRFGPIALIAMALLVALSMGWHKYLSFDVLARQSDALQALVRTKPVLVMAVFVGIYVAATTIALPGAIWLTIAGGFLFGPIVGTALSASSATLGATFLFLAAQSALGGGLKARAGGFVAQLEAGFQKNAFSYLLTLRLLPIAPFFGVNLAAAFLGVRLGTFVLATAIGIIPGGFIYAWLGSGIEHVIAQGGTPNLSIIFSPQVIGPLLGLAALALLPIVWRLVSGKKQSGPE